MKRSQVTKTQDTSSENYICEHCNRTFLRPGNYKKHVCEQRRRWDERDRPANRIAYNAWLSFYASCQPSRKQREYRDFIDSQYYSAFVRFGTYCTEIRAVGVPSLVEHMIRSRVPIDNWSSDRQYSDFLRGYLLVEDHYDATRRSLEHMVDLSHQQNIQLCDVFRFVNSNLLCMRITQGHISPWVLYQCSTGKNFLFNLDDSQRALIYEYIEPQKWNIKFKRDQHAVDDVVKLLSEISGL